MFVAIGSDQGDHTADPEPLRVEIDLDAQGYVLFFSARYRS